MRRVILVLLVAALLPTYAFAKVARITLKELVKQSDVIVLAKVESIEQVDGTRYATARMSQVWKGTAKGEVQFRSSPTWVCDESDAKEGETVVLFLVRAKKSRFQLAHHGRGRLPVRELDGTTYATVLGDVDIPADTSTKTGLDPDSRSRVSVNVSTLKELVTALIDTKN